METLDKVTHNFQLKIRNILELTICCVKFVTTCPSVIVYLQPAHRHHVWDIYVVE